MKVKLISQSKDFKKYIVTIDDYHFYIMETDEGDFTTTMFSNETDEKLGMPMEEIVSLAFYAIEELK